MTDPLRSEDEAEAPSREPTEDAKQPEMASGTSDEARASTPPADPGGGAPPAIARNPLSPVGATLIGWVAVALWNAGDIARMPLRPSGLTLRLTHFAVDLGHVLAVALVVVAGVALWNRFGPRKWFWSAVAVAIAAGTASPLVLSADLAGALDRLFPDIRGDWFLPAVCVAMGQAVTASFLLGRLCARLRLRWLATVLGLALIVANDFVLKNGYPGTHVLLLASGATLLAAGIAGATIRRPRFTSAGGVAQERSVGRRFGTRLRGVKSLVWVLAAAFAVFTIVRTPSSGLQVELLERDTPVLFRYIRFLYAPAKIGDVAIPSKLRHWFENRANRAPIPPTSQRFLPEGPIVILITVDALRADILLPRYRQAAPNLHEMRAKSVYFAQARSSSTGTLLSLATLFTGRHQSMLTWTTGKGRRRRALQGDLQPRFPELLQKAGVHTVAARSITMMAPSVGMARGFVEDLEEPPGANYESSSLAVAEMLIERLRRQGPGPMFFYAHMLDPHAPYETYGKPAKSKFDAYLVEVSVVDENIGKIRRVIEQLGLKQRTAFIISADHGEGFGEHRIFTHDKALYDVLVHVPLMVELPGVRPRTVNDFVSVMDLAPTVLDLFRVPTPGSWVAESLVPFLAGGRGDPTRVFLMEKGAHKAMLFPDGLKLMKRRSALEIYDVRRDPQENIDLWEKLGDEGKRRLALLDTYIETHAKSEPPDEEE